MKHRKQSSSSNSVARFHMFDEHEIEVCEILLNLGTLIHQSQICPKGVVPFTWGIKRRRSNKDSMAAATTTSSPSSPPSPPPIHTRITKTTTFHNDDDDDDKVDRNLEEDKVEASSPATPLSFSPSESDYKSKHSSPKKGFKKRTREEWLEIIEGLTQSREVLRGEVENVRSYYNKLKAFNMELKAMKQERLKAYVRQQLPHMEINNGISIRCHQNNYVVDPMVLGSKLREEFQYPYYHVTPLFSSSNGSNGSGAVRYMSPRGIPDLNVALEEVFGMGSSQPSNHGQTLDKRKAMAAEKRMIRRMINIKKKNEQRCR